jgi:beta-glucosidase
LQIPERSDEMVKQIAVVLMIGLFGLGLIHGAARAAADQPILGLRSVVRITQDGLQFKDLNKNGRLDIYEDWRQLPENRAKDLLKQMTLEEKAGVMMHGTAPASSPAGAPGSGDHYDLERAEKLIAGARVNSFITRLRVAPENLAKENNMLQELGEKTRLGIPLTISSDPRNHFQFTEGVSLESTGFSQWPETLGFAAVGDPNLVKRFGEIARQEYRAVGIQEALSPQADLATEPRWSRATGTFGEDAELAKKMVRAYIEGFQNGAEGINNQSVVAVVKHWVGYGAQLDGFDSHSSYGQYAVFPSGNFAYHLIPFTGAFAARVGGVMPTYSILRGLQLNGRPLEQVGAGFNRQLLTELLRGQYGFDGVIVSDWAITKDCVGACVEGAPAGERPSFSSVGMPWGVETLSKEGRFVKAVLAGIDQFGGTEESDILVDAVHDGKLTEARLDESVYRILLQKFRQGLFENPYVDASEAKTVVGSQEFREEASRAQRRSLVLLQNKNHILPFAAKIRKIYLYKVSAAAAREHGLAVVDKPEDADVAVMRVAAPFERPHPGYVFGSMQHEGNLGFPNGNADLEAILKVSAKVPTVVTVYLDRPAILTNINDQVAALVGNFGVSDSALMDVLTGKAAPEGHLPFELPSSMTEVETQAEDAPHDTAHPLYRFEFGLKY